MFLRLLFGSGLLSLREKLQIASERKVRHFVAVDETCVKVNGEQY